MRTNWRIGFMRSSRWTQFIVLKKHEIVCSVPVLSNGSLFTYDFSRVKSCWTNLRFRIWIPMFWGFPYLCTYHICFMFELYLHRILILPWSGRPDIRLKAGYRICSRRGRKPYIWPFSSPKENDFWLKIHLESSHRLLFGSPKCTGTILNSCTLATSRRKVSGLG